MMYERLLIARDLLREDGVIFISIDNNEDSSFATDSDKINFEETFKELSPETDIWVM